MTVQDLINELKRLNPQQEVVMLVHDDGEEVAPKRVERVTSTGSYVTLRDE